MSYNKLLRDNSKIIKDLYIKAEKNMEKGFGPFFAAIYDEIGNLIAESSNSVVTDNCSNHHAEINAIRIAEQKLKTYDLSQYNLSIYITAEPCVMCMGAIMWSGIKKVFYGVSTKDVEQITGFDEGYKPDWIKEFNKRGIYVQGEIEVELGRELLKKYVSSNYKVYKPERKN